MELAELENIDRTTHYMSRGDAHVVEHYRTMDELFCRDGRKDYTNTCEIVRACKNGSTADAIRLISDNAAMLFKLPKAADGPRRWEGLSTYGSWVACAACTYDRVAVVEHVLELTDVDDDSKDVMLSLAAKHGKDGTMARFLLKAGARCHDNWSSSLIVASACGNPEVAKLLLASGADVSVSGDKALRDACDSSSSEIVALLLAAGADVHANDEEPILNACVRGLVGVVRLLVEAGANIDARDGGPMRGAVNCGKVDVVQYLLVAGAPLKHLDWDKFYPFVQRRILQCVRKANVKELPIAVAIRWVECQRVHRVLLGVLQRVRARLDRPPTEALGTSTPTRKQLTAHLRTAGRRFAREYWTEGLPIFFPDTALGPMPDEFAYPPELEDDETEGPQAKRQHV